ncbi:hypothetical protein GCM10015535_61250 [Streptomyces gelaticus]|uniref:HTH-like domain-containing protein n=1 Tax=Streptomyces gelaticus TaxID=285446 RepID=A0ABQ2W7H3_9ACTN|nr:metal ABC transporter permease [Streptomyces gelaticus]GGV94895.1 hypothetical protein GCM10015535_61250 [Streptomyces gelaticus]
MDRGAKARAERQGVDDALVTEIREIHAERKETYGIRRIQAELCGFGHSVNRKRVGRLIRKYGPEGRHRPRTAARPGRDEYSTPAPHARRGVVGRSPRLSQDTIIGLLFVGMLSLGVIIVSRSQSFAVDLTGFLFGDVLAVRSADLAYLGGALMISVLGYRPFVALVFDERKAHTLGLRPHLAHAALLALLTLAVVASGLWSASVGPWSGPWSGAGPTVRRICAGAPSAPLSLAVEG